MTDLDALPTSREEIAAVQPEFPRLKEDSPKECPCSVGDIKRYVAAEMGKKGHDLFFGRTAQVGEVRFWIWGLIDNGSTYYVDVSIGPKGAPLVAMGSGEGLTPEQHIALRFARHWRKSP